MKQYDYIIIGAGCAGLSLLMRLLDSDSNAKVLLLDKSAKNNNDRTWCFWEKKKGYFEDIVYRQWNDLSFNSSDKDIHLNTGGYTYKMIRGVDFYEYCFNRIKQSPGVDFEIADIQSIKVYGKHCSIITLGKIIEAASPFVFSSIPEQLKTDLRKVYLLQHFKGWIIRTKEEHNIKPCLMDFRVDQSPGTVFVYTLPLDSKTALIEYTVFSSTILPDENYTIALTDYIKTILQLDNYTIEHIESGAIPMTNHRFPFYQNGMYYIGSAGGQTKPSSGYTFNFIQKQSDCIAAQLKIAAQALQNCGKPPARFMLYDSILLKILSDNIMPGKEIFTRLFQRLPAHLIFKFLDNETTLVEEFNILNSMPSKIFLPVAIKQMIGQLRY